MIIKLQLLTLGAHV